MFITEERIRVYRDENPNWRERPYEIIPDMAVEVASPNSTFSRMEENAHLYLSDGVKRVWVLDGENKVAYVYDAKTPDLRRTVRDTLDGEGVIEGLEIVLNDIFNPTDS